MNCRAQMGPSAFIVPILATMLAVGILVIHSLLEEFALNPDFNGVCNVVSYGCRQATSEFYILIIALAVFVVPAVIRYVRGEYYD